MKEIKILYIITLPDIGGAQVHLSELIQNLPKHVNPYLIIGKPGWLSETLIEIVSCCYFVKWLVRDISPMNDIKAILEIKKIIQEIQPNLIHCHSSKAGFIGRVAAKICNVPSVFTAHGWAFTEGVSKKKQFLYKSLEKYAAGCTRKIICVSEYDRKIAIKQMPEYVHNFVTIHNGISDVEFSQSNQYDSEVLNIAMVARFSIPKDHRMLIQAVYDLNQVSSMFHLTLVGDGPLCDREKLFVKELGLSNTIDFLGTRTDVEKILATQDIFLLISNWEGFPISILEAMRQSLPVIASNVGGVSEAVEDGVNGFLIPRGNKEMLKQRLLEIYQDKKKRFIMGEKSREKYLLHFSSDKMINKILKVYEGILEDN